MLSTRAENISNILVKAKKRSAAELIYKQLNGIFSIYKPPDTTTTELIRKLKYAFLKGLNGMACRPVEKFVRYDAEKKDYYLEDNKADTVQGKSSSFTVRITNKIQVFIKI